MRLKFNQTLLMGKDQSEMTRADPRMQRGRLSGIYKPFFKLALTNSSTVAFSPSTA
jgi:hypothetical protein